MSTYSIPLQICVPQLCVQNFLILCVKLLSSLSLSVTHGVMIGRVNPSDLATSWVGRWYVPISCDKYILLLILFRYIYMCRTDIHGSICEGQEISRSIFDCDVGIYEVHYQGRCRQGDRYIIRWKAPKASVFLWRLNHSDGFSCLTIPLHTGP